MSNNSDVKTQESNIKPASFKFIPKQGLYLLVIGILTGIVFIFSIVMIVIANGRNTINNQNYIATSSIYQNNLRQSSPTLAQITIDSDLNKIANERIYEVPDLIRLANNTKIISTDAKVLISADFVKKGLEYQPSFKTQFEAIYELKNEAQEDSVLAFNFPFPAELSSGELSDVVFRVDGQEYNNVKSNRLKVDKYTQASNLYWEGKISAGATRQIFVSYKTIGLATFSYQGLENNTSAQNFNMQLTITGTRAYNVNSGLSVDSRDFSDNGVILTWNKPNLFSTPNINVSVGEKTAPSNKVSRIYLAMTPIYIAFVFMLIWLGFKSNKLLKIRDLITISFLFMIYFPLLHYLTSFTIDPTMEFYEGFKEVGYFSMPLYSAFALSLSVITSLIVYLYSQIYGLSFSLKSALPTTLIMFGFFPLVITIPEYSILLVLLGILILSFLWIQVRVKESR